MNHPPNFSSFNEFQRLPKVDLHRHLEGTLRLNTLREVAAAHQIELPAGTDLARLVQVQQDEPFTSDNFLSKFATLRLFYVSPEIIRRAVYEAFEDAAKDGVIYMELRFSPVALTRVKNYPMSEAMDWVIASAQKASRDFNITAGLIVCILRHESRALAEEITSLSIERAGKGIAGLDLAGDEVRFSALPFADLFQQAKAAGLGITIHAGEWGPAENIRQAVEVLGADRIGHGVRVLEDPQVVALVRERGTAFEVCPTSNYQTGGVTSLAAHPLARMVNAGVTVTINTDDPAISQITLTNEYRVACAELKLSRQALQACILAAARASFLPPGEREKLVNTLGLELF